MDQKQKNENTTGLGRRTQADKRLESEDSLEMSMMTCRCLGLGAQHADRAYLSAKMPNLELK